MFRQIKLLRKYFATEYPNSRK